MDRKAIQNIVAMAFTKNTIENVLRKYAAHDETSIGSRLMDAIMRDCIRNGVDGSRKTRKWYSEIGKWCLAWQLVNKFGVSGYQYEVKQQKESSWPNTIKALKSLPQIGEFKHGYAQFTKTLGSTFDGLMLQRFNHQKSYDPLGRGLPMPKKMKEEEERAQKEKLFNEKGYARPHFDRQFQNDLKQFANMEHKETMYLTEKDVNGLRITIKHLKRMGMDKKNHNFWAFLSFTKPNQFDFLDAGQTIDDLDSYDKKGWLGQIKIDFVGSGPKTKKQFLNAYNLFKKIREKAQKRMKSFGDKNWEMPSWGWAGT